VKTRQKLVATMVVALGLGVAAPVFAATSGTFTLGTTGVAFNSGTYQYGVRLSCGPSNPSGSGFTYSGYLKDTSKDGNAVFVHAKVYSYGYAARVYNSDGNGTSKYVSQLIKPPGDCWADSARVEACQDRGSLFSDLCNDKAINRF
jgi:hypothetical protein